jgi:predicted flap endonuclease-1-like 5' DNA nuclease
MKAVIKPDSLQRIKGIGPSIEPKLVDLGIKDLESMAFLSDEKLNEISGDAKGKDFLRASRKQLIWWRQRAKFIVGLSDWDETTQKY